MKKINKDELYKHVGDFLAAKGVELKDGPYANRLRKGCVLLTDCINFAQAGVEKAKTQMDAKLERMRQVIHEKTAPRTSPAAEPPPASQPQPESPPKPQSESQPEPPPKSQPEPSPEPTSEPQSEEPKTETKAKVKAKAKPAAKKPAKAPKSPGPQE